MKKILALLLAAAMIAVALAGCGYNPTTDTLVIATPTFEKKFNPMYAESAYDRMPLDQIFVSPMRLDKDNKLIDWGGSIDSKEIKAEDGSTHVLYTVKVKKGMEFTDGEPVTIDDYLYTLYAYADPGYSGPSSSFHDTVHIIGMQEYYYDDPGYAAKVADIEKKIAAYKPTDAEIKANAEIWAKDNDMEVSDFMPGGGFYEEYNLASLIDAYASKLRGEYIAGNLKDGIDVPEISGVKRVDDYTCTVEFYDIDIYGDLNINMSYIPAHYYGEIKKGEADNVLTKNMDQPMGSGPYIWAGFENNIVSVVANEKYFEGNPYIKNVRWQYVPEADLIASLAGGVIDICNPSASDEKISDIEKQGFAYTLSDANGYGYIGVNAKNLEKDVRQGLFYLFNRKPAVEGYFGRGASIIERPMTTTLAEYPHDAKEYYGYSPDKALECFKRAGYEQKNGKLVRGDKQLVINAFIGGDGKGDHPSYPILTQAAEALKGMGGELIINDVQFSVLQSAMNDGSADVFCLAWGAVNTCDKTTLYKTGAGQNRYNFSNERVDELLDLITKTIDLKERSKLVAEMLDIVMEEAIEMPVYQRKDMIVYNPAVVDMSTVPETTAYWNYSSQLWKLKLK